MATKIASLILGSTISTIAGAFAYRQFVPVEYYMVVRVPDDERQYITMVVQDQCPIRRWSPHEHVANEIKNISPHTKNFNIVNIQRI